MTEDDQTGAEAPIPGDTLEALRDVMSRPAIERLAREVLERLGRRDGENRPAPRDEINQLCRALCARYNYTANQFVARLIRAGVSTDRIYRAYLAEAARVLGRRWESDSLSFEEVGLATTRIYLIMSALRHRAPASDAKNRPRLAFAAVPGENHVLGVEMAVDLFRREGWDVVHLVDRTHDEILDAVRDVSVVLVGLSASGRRRRAALLRLVVALRVVRPDLKILLSGAITQTEPNLIAQVGIDAIVRDIPEALRVVGDLLDRPKT